MRLIVFKLMLNLLLTQVISGDIPIMPISMLHTYIKFLRSSEILHKKPHVLAFSLAITFQFDEESDNFLFYGTLIFQQCPPARGSTKTYRLILWICN